MTSEGSAERDDNERINTGWSRWRKFSGFSSIELMHPAVSSQNISFPAVAISHLFYRSSAQVRFVPSLSFFFFITYFFGKLPQKYMIQ